MSGPCRTAPAAGPMTIACVILFARSVTQRFSLSFGSLVPPRQAGFVVVEKRNVVTTMLFAEDEHVLRLQVLTLERRVHVLLGIVRLLFVLVRLFGLRLDSHRVPSGETKSAILAAIERAKGSIPISFALRVLGLSVSRYHTWRRLERACSLEERSSCPRTVPNQLTCREIATIQQMATGMEYWHMPIRALALHASALARYLLRQRPGVD